MNIFIAAAMMGVGLAAAALTIMLTLITFAMGCLIFDAIRKDRYRNG